MWETVTVALLDVGQISKHTVRRLVVSLARRARGRLCFVDYLGGPLMMDFGGRRKLGTGR